MRASTTPRSSLIATLFATTSSGSSAAPTSRAPSRSRRKCRRDRRSDSCRLSVVDNRQPRTDNDRIALRAMTLTAEDRKADLVNRLAAEARARVAEDQAESAEQFVRRYFAL